MENQKMRAAILERPFSIEVKEVDVPTPGPDEVLIRVHCIGICGSDVHYYEHGKIGRYEVKKPIILGHEVAGDVVMVGSQVTNLSVGDRVAIEPGVTCGRCSFCKSGRYNLCSDVVFMATPPHDGAWADYLKIRSDFVYRLPDQMSYEEGALLEPFSVGLHAMKRGNVSPGDRLLIQGLGPIGLLTILAAKLFGIKEIYATDVIPLRLQKAKELGVTSVINPAEENVQETLDFYTNKSGVDIVVETTGNDKAIANTVDLVNRGGRIILIGLPTTNSIPIDINKIVDGEIDVHGVFRYANTYRKAIDLIMNSDINLEKIITHKFSLSQIKEAIEVVRTQKDKSIKVMIYPKKDL